MKIISTDIAHFDVAQSAVKSLLPTLEKNVALRGGNDPVHAVEHSLSITILPCAATVWQRCVCVCVCVCVSSSLEKHCTAIQNR